MKKMLTIKEVALIFNVSVTTMYRLLDSRKIPFYKIGRTIRCSEEDIMKFLEENKVYSMK